MIIVQTTAWDGVFSATPFTLAAPTTAGNSLIIAVSLDGLGGVISSIVTDAGDSVPGLPFATDTNGAYNTSGSELTTAIFWIPSGIGGATTMTITASFSMDVWVHEINSAGMTVAAASFNDSTIGGGNSTTATGTPLNGTGGNNLYIACMTEGAIVSVASPWTLDPTTLVPGGAGTFSFGAAHLIGTGIMTPVFIQTPSGKWSVSGVVFAENVGPCQLTATPSSTTFVAEQCATGIATQDLAVINVGGGGPIAFTVSANQPWITLSATSGTTPAFITVGIDTLNLAGGVYMGVISFASASCGNPTVPIALTITVPTCPYPLSRALTDLADRLYDPNNQFWTAAELTIYVQEALRSWNAFTGFWRGDFLFNAVAGTLWYDITDPAVAPLSLRLPTLTDADLLTEMQYHLLEPPVGVGTWLGSAQFSTNDMESAVLRRRDEVLGITGCQILRILVPAVPGRTILPNNIIDLRRVTFIPTVGQGDPVVLWQDDRWSWQTFEPLYTQAPRGTPNTWSVSTQPFLTFDVDVQPGVPGQYELLVIQAASPLPFQCATFPLLLPDDWAWVIKWGALADLLGRESNAKDELRQKYAEGRYKQGCALLTAAPAVLGIRLNNLNLTLQLDSVKSADDYNPTWEGQTPSQPQEALTAGLNLLALLPAPDAGTYSLLATVIENAPVPTTLSSCILVPRDIYDVIIDEAQHLAAFKMGGAEFLATMPQHQRFMELASLYQSRLNEQGTFSQILQQQSQLEAEFDPRYSADLDPAAGAEG